MLDKLGAIELASDVLQKSNIGLWAFEFDEGEEPRMYVDEVMRDMFGLSEQVTPEEIYHAWFDNINYEFRGLVNDTVSKMIKGENAEVQYPWHKKDGTVVIVRFGGVRNLAYKNGVRVEGVHQNISSVIRFDHEQRKNTENIINGFLNDYDAVYLIDADDDGRYKILSENPVIQDATKYAKSFCEVMQICADSFIHPADRDAYIDYFCDFSKIKERLANNASYSFEHRIKIYGSYEWHRGTAKKINEREIIVGFADCNEEVAARIQQFELIQAIASDYSALYYIDIATGSIVSYLLQENNTDAMASLFDITKPYREAFQSYVNNFVYESDRKQVFNAGSFENVQKKLAYNKTYAITYRSIKNEEIVFCEMKFFRAEDGNGNLKGIALTFAYKNEEIMGGYINKKLISEYISVFMVDLKNDKYRVYRKSTVTDIFDRPDLPWSTAMAEFAEYCDPEYVDVVRDIGRPDFLRKELMNSDRREYMYRFGSKDKPWRRAIIQVIDRNVYGVPVNVVATFMNIDAYQSKIEDQKKRLIEQQLELEEAKRLSDEASEAKTRFLFNMSHDIRTPMNAITGYTTMAKKYIDKKERVWDCLEKIDSAGHNLLQLINQVLDMSRIESGKVVLSEEPADVMERAYEMISIINQSAEAKGIKARCVIKYIKDRCVYADAGRVNQVILNVLGNAVKYTPEGGSITYTVEQIDCTRPGYGTYIFSIEDTGYGMSKEYVDEIFEPFSREKSSTVSKIEGTGLGMSIVKRLVDLMGGEIDITSEIGKGTKISIILPLRLQEEKADATKEEKVINPDVLKGKRVLLVEDNEMNREIAKELLLDQGMLVDEAEDGDIALDILRKVAESGDYFYYAVVLMDVQMPRMDGYTATRAIRAIPTPPGVRLPIVAMTANAFEEDRRNAFEAGMDAHLAKPIDVQKLWDTLINFV